MISIYVYVLDTMADWEIGYVTTELLVVGCAVASEFFTCKSTSSCRAGISRAHRMPWIFFLPFGTVFPVLSCKIHSPRLGTKSRASSTSSGPRSRIVFSGADGISRRTQKFSDEFVTILFEFCAMNSSVGKLMGGGN